MRYPVAEVTRPEQSTAVIAEATSWESFPALWRSLLDEVWAVVRATDEITPNRNVMLYKDDVPNVEIGVEVAQPFAARGRVRCSVLPAGRLAIASHRGSYAELGAAHVAIIEWCQRHGRERAGPRWEIYAHHHGPAPDTAVEVCYLLR